jgi:hypothetical protein
MSARRHGHGDSVADASEDRGRARAARERRAYGGRLFAQQSLRADHVVRRCAESFRYRNTGAHSHEHGPMQVRCRFGSRNGDHREYADEGEGDMRVDRASRVCRVVINLLAVRAPRARYFSLSRQRKVPQRKATPNYATPPRSAASALQKLRHGTSLCWSQPRASCARLSGSPALQRRNAALHTGKTKTPIRPCNSQSRRYGWCPELSALAVLPQWQDQMGFVVSPREARSSRHALWVSAPKGSRTGCPRQSRRGMECRVGQRGPQRAWRDEGCRAARGRLFFGYFLLAKQKKVTRPRCANRNLNSYTINRAQSGQTL